MQWTRSTRLQFSSHRRSSGIDLPVRRSDKMSRFLVLCSISPSENSWVTTSELDVGRTFSDLAITHATNNRFRCQLIATSCLSHHISSIQQQSGESVIFIRIHALIACTNIRTQIFSDFNQPLCWWCVFLNDFKLQSCCGYYVLPKHSLKT